MNERIRELAEQTFYYGNWEGDGIYTGQLDLEKFAELLFDEFCDVVIDCDEDPKLILHEPYSTIIAKLTNHFYGVEE
jgi:hypothetical protein